MLEKFAVKRFHPKALDFISRPGKNAVFALEKLQTHGSCTLFPFQGQQEWSIPETSQLGASDSIEYTLEVTFNADIFGTFRQSLLFHFTPPGSASTTPSKKHPALPVLRQDLCVDVHPGGSDDTSGSTSADGVRSEQDTIDQLIEQSVKWDQVLRILIWLQPFIKLYVHQVSVRFSESDQTS